MIQQRTTDNPQQQQQQQRKDENDVGTVMKRIESFYRICQQ